MQGVTLSTIKSGAAEDRFQYLLKQVIDNIQDPNTPATVKREITLRFIFEPDEDREQVDVLIEASAKVAGLHRVKALVQIVLQDGELAAVQPYIAEQTDVFSAQKEQEKGEGR